MMTEIDRLTTRQQAAISALLTAPTITAAAETIGAGEKTIRRWLAEPAFRSALADAEGALIDGAVRRLLALQADALDALGDVLATGTPAQRLRAASIVLDSMMRLRELRTIEYRLAALEAAYLPHAGER